MNLHLAVFKMLHPEFIGSGENSVDHIIPEEKLNNRAENLREATRSQQARNKCKKAGTSSKYVGVSQRKNGTWSAHLMVNGKIHGAGTHKLENDAVRALNAKATEIFGDRARIQEIIV
jgi:hypothetical protein